MPAFFMDGQQKYINENLQRDWEIQLQETYTEAQVLDALALKIAMLIDRNPESFFQLMYRLDISENKLNAILFQQDAAMQVAHMVYERQLQKARSRQNHKPDDNAEDRDLRW